MQEGKSMNQQQRAVVQQALEALGNITNFEGLEKARAALRQLLEQPEPVQEPDIFPDEAYEMGLERIAYYTIPPAQPAAVQDWKDRLIAQHEETILWQAKRIAELTDQQPAQPAALSLEDSLKVTKVCCGDYANCHAPCTPRGRWQAQPAAWVGLTDEELRRIEAEFRAERVRTSDEEYLVIYPGDYWQWQRAIEQALREKNGGAA